TTEAIPPLAVEHDLHAVLGLPATEEAIAHEDEGVERRAMPRLETIEAMEAPFTVSLDVHLEFGGRAGPEDEAADGIGALGANLDGADVAHHRNRGPAETPFGAVLLHGRAALRHHEVAAGIARPPLAEEASCLRGDPDTLRREADLRGGGPRRDDHRGDSEEPALRHSSQSFSRSLRGKYSSVMKEIPLRDRASISYFLLLAAIASSSRFHFLCWNHGYSSIWRMRR